MEDLVEQLLRGDKRALARLITLVERDDERLPAILSALRPSTGHAYLVGITGPPGSGKSTLTDALIQAIRQQGKTIGVLAVDPNSPFTGGAVLGDRVRMQRHVMDDGVYVRSMGARGHLGGLAGSSRNAARVMDAYGLDYVVLETVGVGQSELEVGGICDTTVVVVNPSQGDEIQAIKAGILEIADIFVVNKADLAGADRAMRQLRETYSDDMKEGDWLPPILKAVASKGEGVEELLQKIEEHRAYVKASGLLEAKRRAQLRDEVVDIVSERARARALRKLGGGSELGNRLSDQPLNELDPFEIARDIMASNG